MFFFEVSRVKSAFVTRNPFKNHTSLIKHLLVTQPMAHLSTFEDYMFGKKPLIPFKLTWYDDFSASQNCRRFAGGIWCCTLYMNPFIFYCEMVKFLKSQALKRVD